MSLRYDTNYCLIKKNIYIDIDSRQEILSNLDIVSTNDTPRLGEG